MPMTLLVVVGALVVVVPLLALLDAALEQGVSSLIEAIASSISAITASLWTSVGATILAVGIGATIAILTGLVAKEAVIASYAVMYAQNEGTTERSAGLRAAVAGTMTPLVAFAFMVFVLIYCPCISTISAIKHETGSWKWAGFSVVFSLSLAWMLAFGIIAMGGLLA